MRKFEKAAQNVFFLEMPAERLGETVVFINGNHRFLIDCGSSDYAVTDVIVPALRAMGYGPRDIDYLVFTHCHPENFGGAYKFKKLSERTKIVPYATQVRMMKNPTYYLNKICSLFPENAPMYPEMPGILPNAIYRTNYENDSDKLFSELIPFPAEGHTADSVLWFHPSSGVMICGDAFQGKGVPGIGVPYAQFAGCYKGVCTEYKNMSGNIPETMITGRRYPGDSVLIKGTEECRRFITTSEERMTEIGTEFQDYLKTIRDKRDVREVVERFVSEKFGDDTPADVCYPLITYRSLLTKDLPEEFMNVNF